MSVRIVFADSLPSTERQSPCYFKRHYIRCIKSCWSWCWSCSKYNIGPLVLLLRQQFIVYQAYDALLPTFYMYRGRFWRVQRSLPVWDGRASRRLRRRDVDRLSSRVCQTTQWFLLLGGLRTCQQTLSRYASRPQLHWHAARPTTTHRLLQTTKMFRSDELLSPIQSVQEKM